MCCSTRSLIVVALGPSLRRPSSAASASGGVIRPTTVHQSRPGATFALGTTSQVLMRPSPRTTPKLVPLSVSTASVNMGPPLASALFTGHGLIHRSCQSFRKHELNGFEKPADLGHAYQGNIGSLTTSRRTTRSTQSMKIYIKSLLPTLFL